jgi:alpha-1,3/alpha-1,6-mannosyltransferase
MYRHVLNTLENATMPYADTIAVNSQFTKTVVQETFPALRQRSLPVLYPALDTTSLDVAMDVGDDPNTHKNDRKPIVSLNRYERKKNLQLLLLAVQWIRQHHPTVEIPMIIIAGGYDVHNVENVEYRGELGQMVENYNLSDVVTFEQSISDVRRRTLLRTALAVVYTPSNEHFGIVPLEAMYCETPVLAVASGGPLESIVDGKTGYTRPPTAAAFGEALLTWIQDPNLARTMGISGRQHVQDHFGMTPRLTNEWEALLQATLAQGQARQRQRNIDDPPYRVFQWVYVTDALLAIAMYFMLLYGLRHLQILDHKESLLNGILHAFRRNEDEL